MKNLLAPGEFVQAIEVPTRSRAGVAGLQDLEALRLRHLRALRDALELDASGTVTAARFAFGGMATTAAQRAERR